MLWMNGFMYMHVSMSQVLWQTVLSITCRGIWEWVIGHTPKTRWGSRPWNSGCFSSFFKKKNQIAQEFLVVQSRNLPVLPNSWHLSGQIHWKRGLRNSLRWLSPNSAHWTLFLTVASFSCAHTGPQNPHTGGLPLVVSLDGKGNCSDII